MFQTVSDQRRRDWLKLWLCPQLGPTQVRRWLAEGASLELLLNEPERVNLPPSSCSWLKRPDDSLIDQLLAWQTPTRHIVVTEDAAYPKQLNDLPGAPLVLFVEGALSVLAEPQLAIIGSRNCSSAGKASAQEFAQALAAVGLTITSGLALGIDTAAHLGALASQGLTVAVLGCGLNRCYPATNKGLLQRIVATGGAVVSEFAPDTSPEARNFPRRNRLISGLSLGVLVVEAALESGSLITARYAGEQGRELFAIPGSIRNPLTRGCHQLIRQGARLVETPDEILKELAPQLRPWLQSQIQVEPSVPAELVSLSTEAQQLWQLMEETPLPIDTLLLRTALTPAVVASTLLILELQGLIVRVAGGYQRAVRF